jgi:sugar transferase (PEP-CTERM/EpsH1 system associated)
VKILVLDEEFPYPANTGKRTRSFHLYRRLASRSRIRYTAYGDADSTAAQALRAAGIEPVAVRARLPDKHGLLFYLRLLANLVSPLPYIVTSHSSAAYRREVKASVEEFRPDLLLCEWTPYAMYAKGLAAVKTMVSAHNVEADIWRRYFENETHPLRRWYIREQWRKVDKFERAALRQVDAAFAVSELDRTRLLLARAGGRVALIPNGVDLDYFRPAPQPPGRSHVVFTGSMDWRPNQDAARYFVAEILPLLRCEKPDLHCTFVGRSPPADIRALARVPGIQVTGTVDDVRPYIDRAAVYVVPLRIGGGSRLKILEALAMGRAVVSTPVGAEGLEVEHERDIVLAGDARGFADAVLGLLDDAARCSALGAAGRSLVERKYGWDALADRLWSFMLEVVGQRRAD